MGTFQRVLLARRRMAANATRRTKVRIGVLPFEPERLKKKALVVGRHVNGVEKIAVRWSDGDRRGMGRTNSVAEIAKRRQITTASEAPVRMKPDASGAFSGLAAVDAGQHEPILTPSRADGLPVFCLGADRAATFDNRASPETSPC